MSESKFRKEVMKSLSRARDIVLLLQLFVVVVVMVALLFCSSLFCLSRAAADLSASRHFTSTRMCSSCVPSPLNIMYSFYRDSSGWLVGWHCFVGDLIFLLVMVS